MKKRSSFIADPFGFARKLHSDKWSGQLECFLDDINTYLWNTLSNAVRGKDLGHIEAVINPIQLTTNFNLNEPSWKEIRVVVKAARSVSAPGPSGVP